MDTIGHIDSYESGQLSGWIKRKSSNDPVRFKIVQGDRIVVEGIANQFRKDLNLANIGNGSHGFNVKISPDQKVDATSQLRIVDSDTNREIAANVTASMSIGGANPSEKNTLEFIDTHGHIDSCVNGQLRGWVKNGESDAPVSFQVLANDKVIGYGIANLYREDLKLAGYGSGVHGFDIRLDVKTTTIAGQTITLFDRSREKAVIGAEFCISIIKDVQTISTESDGNKYCVELESMSFESESQISGNLLVDGEHCNIWISENKPAPNRFIVSATVSAESADFSRHLFGLQIEGYNEVCGESLQVIKPISTPWEYLKSSASFSIYGALDNISAYRYDSLKRHMRDPEGTIDPAWLKNVSQAHDLVVEGYKGRKKYPKLVLPLVSNPDVSILVPAYNQFELTYNCIASIILAFNKASYEVILIDDCSDDETVSAMDYVDNLKVVRNEQNLRFLLSCNNGSRSAKGKYITFLNNDTEVTSGWLDSMIAVFDRFDNVGLTGSKLIYPDGKLQEAGGIVWGNGQPWNIGNRENAFAPEYSYTRQVDYVSGAAMMIERSLWESLDGFSEEFAPAYFEDTDLAFKVREVGKKVIYCHDSTVVHFEGMSNGTDLTKGVKRFQSVNFPKFKEKWIRAYKNNGKVGQKLHLEKDRGVEYRALVIDYTTPDPSRDAGSYAAVQEIKLLQSHGFKVTFLPDNIAHMGKTTDAMQRSGVECLYHPFVESIQSYIEQHGSDFDVIYITRYDIARKYIETIRAKTSAKIIFNNADLHFLREIRAVISANGNDFTSALETREKELAVMKSVDVTLSYNEAEHAVIASHNVETNNVFKCPWVLYPKSSETAFEERKGIAFLGGYNHAPNVESVKYLAKHVMPKMLEKDKSIKLYVYGSAVTPEIENLASENIEIVGFAESLDEVYGNCRVFVAPLLSGAGIKGKVLESMSYGVPSVLSPIAAEGTGLSNGVSCLIADTSEEWVDQIITLYNDKSLWNRMAENSSLLTQTNYSFEAGQKAFKKILAHLGIYTLPDTAALYELHKDQ